MEQRYLSVPHDLREKQIPQKMKKRLRKAVLPCYAIFFIILGTNMAVAENNMDDNSLQQILKMDWGYDLPIHASIEDFGTRKRPIVIIPSDEISIAETAYLTIHGWNRGLSRSIAQSGTGEALSGVLWRSLDEGLKFDPVTQLHSYRFERKQLTDAQIETETISFFFRIEPDLPGELDIGMPNGPVVSALNVMFPYEIGWLRYDASQEIDYGDERNSPNLGVGFAYGALGVKATVYVYPMEQNSSLDVEFEQAARGVEALNSDLFAWPDRETAEGIRKRFWREGEEARQVTMLGLTTANGQFIKLRITWHRDQLIDAAAAEFMQAILSLSERY